MNDFHLIYQRKTEALFGFLRANVLAVCFRELGFSMMYLLVTPVVSSIYERDAFGLGCRLFCCCGLLFPYLFMTTAVSLYGEEEFFDWAIKSLM